ncbi:MAG: hypothetical protein ACREBV_05165 [Candidatus Zixiibacteriota bacterium]
MEQQLPQPEKKGLSKGCVIALIVGGVIFVIIAFIVIMIFVKGKDVAKWAFVQAIETEKALIMQGQIPGIDTTAVNMTADGFKANIESPEFAFEQVISFQGFVQQYVTDSKVDSTEAEAFVKAMIECYPELADLYNPAIPMDTELMPDTGATDGQE